MNERAPSPATFARFLSGKQDRENPSQLLSLLRSRFSELSVVAVSAGIELQTAIDAWIEDEGLECVADWLDLATPTSSLTAHLYRARARDTRKASSALAPLVKETHLALRAGDFGPNFRQYLSLIHI